MVPGFRVGGLIGAELSGGGVDIVGDREDRQNQTMLSSDGSCQGDVAQPMSSWRLNRICTTWHRCPDARLSHFGGMKLDN
jgi:hypothetical protein